MNEENSKDAVAQTAAEPEAPKPEPPQDPSPPAAQKGRGNGVAILALLLALAAAGGSGYLWYQQQHQQTTLAGVTGLETAAGQRALEIANLGDRLRESQRNDDRLEQDLAELVGDLNSQRSRLDELPARLSRIENALENVPGIADKARTAWLLSEAEYFLKVGNAQLALAHNPDAALRALELADEKLRDVGDPGLTRVRALIAEESTALRALPRPDAEGIALKLAALARSLQALPMAAQNPASFGRSGGADAELSGLARAWSAIKQAFSGLVLVKRTDEVVVPLRTPIEESLLLRSLETEMALARLALVRGEGGLYRNALSGVASNLRRHFDIEASSVRTTLDQLDELGTVEMAEDLPDISGSLTLLRRLATDQVAG